jgi:hypothetical protein
VLASDLKKPCGVFFLPLFDRRLSMNFLHRLGYGETSVYMGEA